MPNEPALQHVHVGAGNLGLGLVAWLGARAGLSVLLANRASASSQFRNERLREARSYDLVSDNGDVEPVAFTKFLFTDRDRGELLNEIASPRTLLLSTALKEGLEPSIPLLADAIAARVRASTPDPLYVVACENKLTSIGLHDAMLPRLRELNLTDSALGRAVVFVPCMVDRICTQCAVDPGTNRVRVRVEEFASWVLEVPFASDSLLERQFSVPTVEPHVQLVSDLEPFLRRKKWLVNAPHLLIALNAWAQGFVWLDEFLKESYADEVLGVLLKEAARALLTFDSTFSRDDLAEFNLQTQERFRRHPDRVLRIAWRFTGPDLLHGFVQDFYEKTTQPTLKYMFVHARSPYWTSRTLFLVTQLVHQSRYQWSGKAGKESLVSGTYRCMTCEDTGRHSEIKISKAELFPQCKSCREGHWLFIDYA